MPAEHLPEIAVAAAAQGLDATLVRALVLVESGGQPWAWNPEPRYRYLWDVRRAVPFRVLTEAERVAEFPPPDFPTLAGDPDQEWWGQQASWGLMQVMGAVARERGLRVPYLPVLCDPATNLGVGCGHLAALLAWAHGNVAQALAAWNGGKGGNTAAPYRNQAYADRVLHRKGTLT